MGSRCWPWSYLSRFGLKRRGNGQKQGRTKQILGKAYPGNWTPSSFLSWLTWRGCSNVPETILLNRQFGTQWTSLFWGIYTLLQSSKRVRIATAKPLYMSIQVMSKSLQFSPLRLRKVEESTMNFPDATVVEVVPLRNATDTNLHNLDLQAHLPTKLIKKGMILSITDEAKSIHFNSLSNVEIQLIYPRWDRASLPCQRCNKWLHFANLGLIRKLYRVELLTESYCVLGLTNRKSRTHFLSCFRSCSPKQNKRKFEMLFICDLGSTHIASSGR